MIIGIGSDLCDIRRIESSIERFGERFLQRVFTAAEREKGERLGPRAAFYAKRFAAKEACSKALGTGIAMGVGWQDMEIVNLPGGQPVLRLDGAAAARLTSLTPPGLIARLDLTITDDHSLAQAFVVISAWPADWPGALTATPESGASVGRV